MTRNSDTRLIPVRLSQWLGRRAAGPRLRPTPRRTRRPQLERLDDRTLLSTIIPVTNPNDSGTGSLRAAIDAANASTSDATIDLTGVSGTITLTSGELLITDPNNLTITGPGANTLKIVAGTNSRILDSAQTASNLTVSGLELTGGNVTPSSPGPSPGFVFGGAILMNGSSSSLTIESCTIASNSASDTDDSGTAFGGGIFSRGKVTVSDSTIASNSATATGLGVVAFGGGIQNNGDMTVSDSTIASNSARATGLDGVAIGGGISSFGDMTVSDSTITSNSASGSSYGEVGGISAPSLTVTSSTIAFNSASGQQFYSIAGGIEAGVLTVSDSTIAFNSASGAVVSAGGGILADESATISDSTIVSNSASAASDYSLAGGVIIRFQGPMTMSNSILALNTATEAPDLVAGALTLQYSLIGDGSGSSTFNIPGLTEAPVGSPDVNGNLIGGPIHGTIDPKLGPLTNNGGPTATMALLPGSPAIDAGNNALVPAGVTTDQRGAGFSRIVNGTVDIGAFELQQPSYDIVLQFNQNQVNHSGSTVPVKIQVDNTLGQNVGSSSLSVTAVSVIGPSGQVALQSPGNSQPGDLFKFDPTTGTYRFNLKTTGYAKGTYTLYFTVGNDPTLYSVTFNVG
jgi:hypothetical protein